MEDSRTNGEAALRFNMNTGVWSVHAPKGYKVHCYNCKSEIDPNTIFYFCKEFNRVLCKSCMLHPHDMIYACPSFEKEHTDYCITTIQYEDKVKK